MAENAQSRPLALLQVFLFLSCLEKFERSLAGYRYRIGVDVADGTVMNALDGFSVTGVVTAVKAGHDAEVLFICNIACFLQHLRWQSLLDFVSFGVNTVQEMSHIATSLAPVLTEARRQHPPFSRLGR